MTEPWRGDQHPEDDPVLAELKRAQGASRRMMEHFFGRPATPEEQKQFEQQIVAELVQGNVTYPTLERFRRFRPCRKCGSLRTGFFWHPAPTATSVATSCRRGASCLPQVGEHEHFYRWCKRCAYYWWEQPGPPATTAHFFWRLWLACVALVLLYGLLT